MSALTYPSVNWRMRAIEIAGEIKVIFPTTVALPLIPRLSPLEVLTEVRMLTPDCFHSEESREGIALFVQIIDAGGVLLRWPDDVRVLSRTSHIYPPDGLLIYFYARLRLEEHVANLEMGVS